MKLNGSEILIECLKEQGVDTVFGYPGGAVLNIYDALYKHQAEIRHIRTAHEQAAAHAADGYARATGKVGVCIATSGPGATNLVTGIATAYMDSVPMVAITGQVATPLLGKDSFQEVDITGITMPITKHNFIVKDVKKLAPVIRQAFEIAQEGRPGPVLIDICKDVTAALCEYSYQKPEPVKQIKAGVPDKKLESIAKLIQTAKQPVMLTGGGTIIAGACEALEALCEKADIPVCSTLMGLGSFDGTNPLYMGLLGMHGTKASNMAVSKADLLIAVGTRFSDRVISDSTKFAKKAKIIHIDGDAAEIGKNIHAQYSLCGNIAFILQELAQKLEPKTNPAWREAINQCAKQAPYQQRTQGKLTAQYIIHTLYEKTKGDAIITTEVGQNQIWASQFYRFKTPRTFLSSGGLGTMGYGLGAAIGAQFGVPEKRVVNIAGDGSFGMNLNELATVSAYQVPIIEIILNNHVLGMVRQWQTLFYEKRYSATTVEPKTNIAALAQSFGIKGFQVAAPNEFNTALEYALANREPVVINCEIAKDDSVYPIVPPGAPISELITE